MQTELNVPESIEITNESMCPSSVWAMPQHLLQWDKPAIDGPCTIVYNQHWGGQEVTIKADSPTYKDLWHLADKLIRHSGDEHHIYIEDFRHNAERNVWELSTGS